MVCNGARDSTAARRRMRHTALLRFRLPTEEHAYVRALRGGDAFKALRAASDRLRSMDKHAEPPADLVLLTREDAHEDAIARAYTRGVEDARAALWAEINERGLGGVVVGDE
jgi:hypothetical protein